MNTQLQMMEDQTIIIHKRVKYKDKLWLVETVYFAHDDYANPRVRIGRKEADGTYEWELVFQNDLVNVYRLIPDEPTSTPVFSNAFDRNDGMALDDDFPEGTSADFQDIPESF